MGERDVITRQSEEGGTKRDQRIENFSQKVTKMEP